MLPGKSGISRPLRARTRPPTQRAAAYRG
uniref:Uncharacterized protein n=1 Tax=Arundo donax TaxID=35708 RepID=A0A0A9HM03_ARUDO